MTWAVSWRCPPTPASARVKRVSVIWSAWYAHTYFKLPSCYHSWGFAEKGSCWIMLWHSRMMLMWEIKHTQSDVARVQKDVLGTLSFLLADIPVAI